MHKTKKKPTHIEGRRDPLEAKHRHVKSNKDRPRQGQCTGPTKPRTTPTPLVKDNPLTTKHPTKDNRATYLCCFQFHSMCKFFLLQRTPSLVKTLKHGRCKKFANRNLFEHEVPSRFGVDDKFIPNVVLDLRLVPLLMVEHLVITFNSNGPECNALKRCQILIFPPHFLGSHSLNMAYFQLKQS